MPTFQDLFAEALRKHTVATETRDQAMLAEAFVEYNQLLNQCHEEPTLLFSIATILLQQEHNGLAINLFKYVLGMWPEGNKQPQVWNNLGTAYKGEHLDDKARECWQKALSLIDPERSDEERQLAGEYCSNLATLYINTGSAAKGYDYIKQACEYQPENAKTWWNRSLIELEMADYEQGFKNYDYGIETGDRLPRWKGKIPYYNGQSLKGKKVLIYGEQGLGDEIMFAAAIPELIDAVTFKGNVVYECHDRLEDLMKHTFPGLDIHPTRKKDPESTNLDPKSFDYCMGVGSLFRWFGVKKRPPYLKPKPELVDHYKHKLAALGPGLKIGIGYAGGHKRTHGHERSFKLSTLSPILEIEGCEFISLQYTPEATEKFQNHFINTGIRIHHWPDMLYRGEPVGDNYEHTVALIKALDVCVLPNTTAVHVCGAVGTTCLSLTPRACAWRYLGEDDHMVMYENHVALYRENGGWGEQVEEIANYICHAVDDEENLKAWAKQSS